MTSPATSPDTPQPYKVSYLHLRGYRVSRTFASREDAQQFIDNNALIWPLPGVELIPVTEA